MPGALLGQGERVERAAARDLDFDGDRIARGDVGRPRGYSHEEIAHGTVEIGGHILFGQREHGKRLGLGGQRDALLLHLDPPPEIAALIRKRDLQAERDVHGAEGERAGRDAVSGIAGAHSPALGVGSLEDAHTFGFHRTPPILLEALHDVLGIRNPLLNQDLELHRENLAHIDLFLRHKQLEEGQLVPGSIGRSGGGFYGGQFQRRRRQDLPANFGFQGGNNELARLGGGEQEGLYGAGRELAIVDADVPGTPFAGDLQIGELRESGD